MAAWAVALGIFLVLVASATSHGATGGARLDPAGEERQPLSEPQTPSDRQTPGERPRISWYGPGLYGHRTACGARLRRTTQGVAHKQLACGTRVTLHANGRSVTVPVIDRGPHARGVVWDLTAATARSLGLTRTSRARLAYVRIAD